jgi:phosphoenolpyruvate---glycerone phosphotransferase subunit DhaK
VLLNVAGAAELKGVDPACCDGVGLVGASITVSMLDEELRRLWDAPVHTAALRWGR